MASAFLTLLFGFLIISQVKSMTGIQETNLLKQLQAARQANSLPLIWDKSPNSIYNGNVLNGYLLDREHRQRVGKHAELIMGETILNSTSRNERDFTDIQEYAGYVQCINKFDNMLDPNVQEPVASAFSKPAHHHKYWAGGKEYTVGECIAEGGFDKVLKVSDEGQQPTKDFAMKAERYVKDDTNLKDDSMTFTKGLRHTTVPSSGVKRDRNDNQVVKKD